jgi:predicted enzyme related to lactoylglutathione lyase
MIGPVSYIWLYVSDLERSIRFYGETLGLPLARRWHEGAAFKLENLVLGLHLEEGHIVRGNSPVITFNVNGSIEDLCRDLKIRGVQSLKEIATEPYGKIAPLEDPDGHQLLLHEPPQ